MCLKSISTCNLDCRNIRNIDTHKFEIYFGLNKSCKIFICVWLVDWVHRIILFGSAQPRTTLASARLFKVPRCIPPSSPGATCMESWAQVLTFSRRQYLVGNGGKDRGCRLLCPCPETKTPEKESFNLNNQDQFVETCWRDVSKTREIWLTRPRPQRSHQLSTTWRSSEWKPENRWN